MEKIILSCPQCGRQLAVITGGFGSRRVVNIAERVGVRVLNNALGESIGWLKCIPCKAERRFDGKYWLGWSGK